MANRTVLIDLDKILLERFGERRFPSWLVNALKRLIHQDYINGCLRQGLLGTDFAEGALEYLGARLHVDGLENIPPSGRFTFAGNHPLGGIDALAVIAVLGRRFGGQVSFLANDFLMNIKQLEEQLIPVNKLGAQSSDLPRLVGEAFASDRQILVFPAGKCSRRYAGRIQDPEWRKTFITRSRESHRDVIPMWLSGRNSARFYLVDRLCRLFGIRTNIAMLLLPDEMYRGRDRDYRLVFGRPIPWESFTRERRDAEWAAEVRRAVYALEVRN